MTADEALTVWLLWEEVPRTVGAYSHFVCRAHMAEDALAGKTVICVAVHATQRSLAPSTDLKLVPEDGTIASALDATLVPAVVETERAVTSDEKTVVAAAAGTTGLLLHAPLTHMLRALAAPASAVVAHSVPTTTAPQVPDAIAASGTQLGEEVIKNQQHGRQARWNSVGEER
jgi:hypothetical protein